MLFRLVFTAKQLVRYGSSLSIPNASGRSPLDYIDNESDRNLLKVQEEMFRKCTAGFVTILRHFNITIDKSKELELEGTNRTEFELRLKETKSIRPSEPKRLRDVFSSKDFSQIICKYL